MRHLFAILLVVVCVGCSYNTQELKDTLRPPNVPDSAFWVGGLDGGNWYVVHSVHDHRNSAIISVYAEDGKFIVRKNFSIICRVDRPIVWIKELKSQINGYDGEKILITAPTGTEVCWMQ